MNTTTVRKELKYPFSNGSISASQSGEGDILATLRDTLLSAGLSVAELEPAAS